MRAYLLLGVAALSLGACKLDRTPDAAGTDTAQLTAGAPFELGLAPSFDALPYADPVPVSYAPQPVAYDYWNDAYEMNQTYYNQPPAYFNHGGATPLVWAQPAPTGGNLVTRIVEGLIGGGQREYFYQPGYDQPFFVRDPQYAYALDDGRLAMVYDPYGRPLAETLLMQQAPTVARYLRRADSLRDAALVTVLQPLAPDVWSAQRTVLVRSLDDNDGWRKTWIPGANRSPVAIQRLAEVRARKEARDEAHAAWKASRRIGKPEKRTEAKADKPGKQAKSDKGGKGNGKGKGDGKKDG